MMTFEYIWKLLQNLLDLWQHGKSGRREFLLLKERPIPCGGSSSLSHFAVNRGAAKAPKDGGEGLPSPLPSLE
jgi:hypothetical protein